jgi:hypothetical protein
MRTTLAIDDDMFYAAKDLARQQKKPLGQVVSELLRRGFAAPQRPTGAPEPNEPPLDPELEEAYRIIGYRPSKLGPNIVTNEQINALREIEGI